MARGKKVGDQGSNRRRVQGREHDSEESDEEYKVAEEEDCDESDENYSLEGEESEEILADFEESKRVARSRNIRRSFLGRKGDGMIKRLRKRSVCYKVDEDDEVDDDADDDAEFMSLGRKANKIKKPRENKRVSYREVDDEEEEDYEEFVSLGRRRNQRKKPQEMNRESYTNGDENEYEGEDDDDDDDEVDDDDAEYMSLGRKANQIKKPREKKRVSYREVNEEEEDYEEFVSLGRRNQRKTPLEKKRVTYEDEDDDEEEVDDDDDDAEFMSLGGNANQIKKPMEKKRVSYKEVDEEVEEDYAEFVSLGRRRNPRKKTQEKKRVSYTDENEDDEEEEVDDDDDAEFMSLGRKSNQIKKPREKKMVTYREVDEEEEDYAEFVSSGRKRNQRKKPQEKKRVLHTFEDDDDDDDVEFMDSLENANQKKRLREKRKVSYTEDDDEDDFEFMSSSKKRNQINEPQEKIIVSHKEDNEEEEDENDAEFMLSESDFVDDEDESPTMKKNEKVSRYHPPKKSKKSKIKKPTKPKQRNHRFGRKPSSSKERPITNRNQAKIKNKKISKIAKSDSDFVSSASSDHEYTISEEEREQMREARVYCANLRAKLRGKQEDVACGQRESKYPIRKGKEKLEDTKDELGKQVCGICLSEEGKRTVRGVLNCCRHYFCFSCIMEWSKVESRCPLCKQRFATITKAAKSDTGFDSRTVVIPVPECDQVYQPSEEELRGYLDPYESVVCTECHNGGEDALMLLCDICDSPAHTFCAGLGREVPEGNWYCEGCRPTVYGSLNSQRPTPTSDRRSTGNPPELSSPIAGGFDLNEMYVPETPLTQLPTGDFVPAHVGTVATTLRDRRRIHRQIHHRFLNNNRMSDLVSRSASSSGIRLFGSQLDQGRDLTQRSANPREDQVMPSLPDNDIFSPRADQISVPDEHGGSGMGFDSRLGYAQLHPCTNRSSIGSDASPSPYACREVIGPSRASQSGRHAPY